MWRKRAKKDGHDQPGYGAGPFLLDVVVLLYQQERVSLAKAARLAGVHGPEFQRVLAEREIPIRYDLEGDLAALRKWGAMTDSFDFFVSYTN